MEQTNTVRGQILNIQHFCVDDGPGIRTTVFFKGCPLRCAWCHNPETHASCREILFRAEKCRACGACLAACPVGAHTVTSDGTHTLDRAKCIRCGACADACLYDALECAGEEMTVEEVVRDVLSDRIFYETSGGGVTLSGGEPTAQPDFARALLTALKQERLHTAMETAGVCSEKTLCSLIPLVDLFLLDWKHSDDALHKTYTGVSNKPVRDTLDLLEAHGASVSLRCPLIPGINDTEAHMDGIAELVRTHSCILRVELEPYHPLGVGKAESLGRSLPYTNREFMEKARAEAFRNYLAPLISVPVQVS